MTPLPKRKHSTRRKGKRRAAISFSLPNLSACPNCGELKPNHLVCPKCGFYKGRGVVKMKKKERERKRSSSVPRSGTSEGQEK